MLHVWAPTKNFFTFPKRAAKSNETARGGPAALCGVLVLRRVSLKFFATHAEKNFFFFVLQTSMAGAHSKGREVPLGGVGGREVAKQSQKLRRGRRARRVSLGAVHFQRVKHFVLPFHVAKERFAAGPQTDGSLGGARREARD